MQTRALYSNQEPWKICDFLFPSRIVLMYNLCLWNFRKKGKQSDQKQQWKYLFITSQLFSRWIIFCLNFDPPFFFLTLWFNRPLRYDLVCILVVFHAYVGHVMTACPTLKCSLCNLKLTRRPVKTFLLSSSDILLAKWIKQTRRFDRERPLSSELQPRF